MSKLRELVDSIKDDYVVDNTTFPTGIEPMDVLLDGGLSFGITQLVGENQTGKTTLALQIAYGFCNANKNVLYINTKGDITTDDLQRMNLLNYKDKHFIYICEAAYDKVESLLDKFIATDEISLIVIDSIASLMNSGYLLTGSKAIKSDNGNSGYNSKPLSLLIKKLAILSVKKKIVILLTNQYKNTIQMYGRNAGTRTKIGGPKSLINESKYVIEIHSINESNKCSKKFKDSFLGIEAANKGKSFDFYLNKGRHPNRSLPYFFEYGIGYAAVYSLIMLLILEGKITQAGTYYVMDSIGLKTKGMINFLNEFNCKLPKDYKEYVSKYYNSLLDDSCE